MIGTMNIDLFHTGQSEAGLVCEGVFKTPVSGVILDAQTLNLTLEFSDGDTYHLNIPVAETHREKLLFAHRMYVGFIEDGLLMDSHEVPLLYLNDPYGGEFGQDSPLAKPKRSILAFDQFMKRCQFAQAIHRDNLGDEDSAGSVLHGIDPKSLEYSPALMRQMQMAPVSRASLDHAPQMPGPGGATRQSRPIKRPPVQKESDE